MAAANHSVKDYLPLILAVFLLLGGASSNFLVTTALGKFYGDRPNPTASPVATATPAPSPRLKVYSVRDFNCTECGGTLGVIAQLEQAGAEFNNTDVDYSSVLGKELVGKYNVSRLPAVVITGEINASSLNYTLSTIGPLVNGAVVWDKQNPVYVDLNTGAKVGVVQVSFVSTKKCKECSDFNPLLDQLRQAGVEIVSNDRSLQPEDTDGGKKLIQQYNLTKLPALVLSKDAGSYADLKDAWTQVGTIEKDGSFVLRNNVPPFFDLLANKTIGLVQATYLTDKSCENCYNASLHDKVLQSFSVYVKSKLLVDVSSPKGIELVKAYNITAVPTLLLSADASAYARFSKDIWTQVGSVEKDGVFVFRTMAALGNVTYRNLTTGQLEGQQNAPKNQTVAVAQANQTNSTKG